MDSINNMGNINALNSTSQFSNISNVNYISKDSGNTSARQYQQNNHQTLKGEIIDLKNNDITIRLDDGTKIQAKIFNNSTLNIGQTIRFQLTDTPNGPVIENYQANEATANTIIFKALEAAGLPANEKNIAIATELLNNNMSLDKQTILTIQKQSLINKDININSLVIMNKNHIPVTSANTEQFTKYCNYEHRIVKELNSIASDIPKLLDSVADKNNISETISFNEKLISIINNSDNNVSSQISKSLSESLVSTAYLYPSAPAELSSILSNYHVDEALLSNIKDGSATIRDVAATILKCIEKADEIDDYRVSSLNAKNANAFTNISLAKDAFQNPTIQTLLDKYAALQRDNSEIASYMNNYNRAQLISKLRDIPGLDELANKVWNGNITSNDLLKELNSSFLKASEGTIKKILLSSQYKSILTESLLNNWTISPSDLKQEKVIENTYKSMYEQLTKLNDFIKENAPDSESKSNLSHNFKGTQDNIDFMNTLNGMMSYVQLPIKLRNQNIHSDLYVLTNKKSLKQNGSNITILLHLDMDYLGPLDVRLTMSGNTISADFDVIDKDTQALISTNMDHLEYTLMEKGFLLNSNVNLKEKTTELIDNFLEKDTSSTTLKRYTFDIRT